MPNTIYECAFNAWQPEPGDNPDCHKFYRAWAGLKACLGNDFMSRHNGAVHNAICMSDYTWESICRNLKAGAENATVPEQPKEYGAYGWSAEPVDRTRERAREIFVGQYKAKWPENRINSLHAKAKWAEVEDKAISLAKAEHEQAVGAWRNKNEVDRRENDKRYAEWMDNLHKIALYVDAVRDLRP